MNSPSMSPLAVSFVLSQKAGFSEAKNNAEVGTLGANQASRLFLLKIFCWEEWGWQYLFLYGDFDLMT